MDSATAEEIKHHFNVVADGLRTEIRAVAEGGEETRRHLDDVAEGLRTEIRAVAHEAKELKRHFNVIAESLRTDIRTIAEGFIGTNERLDRFDVRVSEELGELKTMMRLSFN